MPIVSQFEPSSGPVDGGTRVTIHGHNFGTAAPHVKDFSASVKVALVDCVIEYRNESRYILYFYILIHLTKWIPLSFKDKRTLFYHSCLQNPVVHFF